MTTLRGRPVHLRARSLALVAVGGAVGTAVRCLLDQAVPSWQGVDVVTLAINVVGAFGLGVLLETLLWRGPDSGLPRGVRLLVGTGFFGGFTTYSTLAVETVTLAAAGRGWVAVGYALGTLLAGMAAAAAGIALSARYHRRGDRR